MDINNEQEIIKNAYVYCTKGASSSPNIGSCNQLLIYQDRKKINNYFHHRSDKHEFTSIVEKDIHNNFEVIEYGFIYHNKYDANWRHFLLETFLGLSIFMELKKKYIELKIIVPDRNPHHIKEILTILQLNNNVIELKENTKINCKCLIIPSNTFNIKSSLQINFVNYFIQECKKLSSFSKTKIDTLFIEKKNGELGNHRRIHNYNNAYNYIKNNKQIMKIIPEDCELYDQVTLLNNADRIITFIGASCDNLIFTHSNSLMYILCAENFEHIGWAKWYTNIYENKCVINCCGFQLQDEDIIKKITMKINYPWEINLDHFEKIINNILV